MKFVLDKNKPVRLISLFSGYDSQKLALDYLGLNVEHWKTCEWAVKSIQALKDLHFEDNNIDYSKGLTKEELINQLFKIGISSNYNNPMTYEQVKRLGEIKLRTIYNNIFATNNLVNIQQAHAKDLEIKDTDKYTYIMTYSYPCQDISSAGLGKGMTKGSGTRSGLLWEVERILNECNGNLPQILLMENVPQVHGKKNIEDFNLWIKTLETLGYFNYWQDLNTKNFGIPQNRNRCFMISILGNHKFEFPKGNYCDNKIEVIGNYMPSCHNASRIVDENGLAPTVKENHGTVTAVLQTFEFPQPQELKLKLKDILEENVDEKYYLSDKAINGKLNTQFCCSKFENCMPKNGIMPTLMARDYKDPKCVQVAQLDGKFESTGRVYSTDGLCPTINTCGGGNREPKILEDFYSNREVREYDYCPTLRADRSGLKVKEYSDDIVVGEKIQECGCLDICVRSKNNRIVNLSKKINNYDTKYMDVYNQTLRDECGALKAGMDHQQGNIVYNNLRIRKLTPKECLRIQGVKDIDIDKLVKNQSNSSLYHLAGDSITTTPLMAIFGALFDINYIDKIQSLTNEYKKG